jgi:hypothetical protein
MATGSTCQDELPQATQGTKQPSEKEGSRPALSIKASIEYFTKKKEYRDLAIKCILTAKKCARKSSARKRSLDRERNGCGSVDGTLAAGRVRGKQEVHIGAHTKPPFTRQYVHTRELMLKSTKKKGKQSKARSTLTWEASEPERKDRPFAAMLVFWLTLTTGGGGGLSPVRFQHAEIGK